LFTVHQKFPVVFTLYTATRYRPPFAALTAILFAEPTPGASTDAGRVARHNMPVAPPFSAARHAFASHSAARSQHPS